jgi:hypothetical protein
MMELIKQENMSELKQEYLRMITEGYSEVRALAELNFPRHVYIRLLVEDTDFNLSVEQARKARADFWVGKIIEDVDTLIDKDDIPGERLKFDKLQYLAKADNPERYGNNSKKIDVNIDLKQFKLLPPEEALKSLSSDPFAIDVDFVEVKDSELL